jgi:hypothetical protein
VIGDLVEEFCVRVHRDGLRNSQRWFWLQALRTSRISSREGWIVQRVIGEAKRRRLIAFSLAVFALLMLYYLSLERIRTDREPQLQVASNKYGPITLPPTSSLSNASQTYKNNPLKTDRRFSAVSYQFSTAREKPKGDKQSSIVEGSAETAVPAPPTSTTPPDAYAGAAGGAETAVPPTSTSSTSSGTIYPFHEPGMSKNSAPPQSVSISSSQERGCFR